MKEDFVTYDLAVKLKKKGFREKCFAIYTPYGGIFKFNEIDTDKIAPCDLNIKDFGKCYNRYIYNNIDAPTISQVLKWLRKEKKIFVTINIGYCYESDEIPFPTNPKMRPFLKGYYYGIWELDNLNDKSARSEYFEDYEKAAIAGIEFVIDNLI